MTKDPIEEAGGENLNNFVSNDPLNRIDILGLYGKDVHLTLTYKLAIDAGICEELAEIIAKADQGVDEAEESNPFSQYFKGLSDPKKMREYMQPHFPIAKDRWKDPKAVVKPNPVFLHDSLKEIIYNNEDVKDKSSSLGGILHSLQDSYSHRGNRNSHINPRVDMAYIYEYIFEEDVFVKTDRLNKTASKMAEQTYKFFSEFVEANPCAKCTEPVGFNY